MPKKKDNDEQLSDAARQRLRAMRGQDGEHAIFTSDLSVNEFLLLDETNFAPAGMVIGTSIYHIGVQQIQNKVSEEMIILSDALYHARELAMRRMVAEAHELGADGIIGVRIKVKHMEWNPDLAEFIALGTAVYYRDPHFDWRVDGKPFTSDLSGQDFWTLLHSGHRPVGMVIGNCVYHVANQSAGKWLQNFGQNKEMENFTQAFYDARELAMERMQRDAEKLGASGIVGVEIHERNYAWSPQVIEFFTVGTAIVPYDPTHRLPTPHLVLTCNDDVQKSKVKAVEEDY
jgi:uncharacterized protein YbjQ (UPF0145 family)